MFEKCEFCEKWSFENVNFVQKSDFEIVNFVKYEIYLFHMVDIIVFKDGYSGSG